MRRSYNLDVPSSDHLTWARELTKKLDSFLRVKKLFAFHNGLALLSFVFDSLSLDLSERPFDVRRAQQHFPSSSRPLVYIEANT